MARKKKETIPFGNSEPQKESYDLDTVLLISSVCYAIRSAIEEKTFELAPDKKCVPKDYAVAAIKKLGLADWLDR